MVQVSDILHNELEQLKADIIRRHEEAGQVASGRTRAAFEVRTSDSNGQLLGNSYVGVLERGRRGGKVPYDFKDILLRWAEAKGIRFANNTDAQQWAWFVMQKIRQEGTALYRSGKTVDVFTTPIADFTERLSKQLTAEYRSKIINSI